MSIFYRGDSLKILKTQIKDKSINLIYINPPFGTTKQYWDEKQDWKALFKEFFRILKDDGMLVIHCSIPFNYELIRAAPVAPSHSWYWLKESATCPLIAKLQPMRIVEEILVWKNKKSVYYSQKVETNKKKCKNMDETSYYGSTKKKEKVEYKESRHRTHFLDMKRDIKGFSTRPKEMVQLIINSYSKENDTILDLFCYKGLSYTCKGNRKWIGIDKHFIPNDFITQKN